MQCPIKYIFSKIEDCKTGFTSLNFSTNFLFPKVMTMTETTLSLGQQLKHAREALNLTIDDVAQKTNLKKNHIESLENDIFILQNVPPAFVRGYVRNYVRFLRLPEELIGSVNYGEVTIPKEVKKAAPIPVKNQKSQTRWVKGLTWLILLGAVGMTLAWWWQEHQKDQASREQLIVNTSENNVATTTSSENSGALTLHATTPAPTTDTATTAPVVAEPTKTNVEATSTPVQANPEVEQAKTEEVKVEVPATPTAETAAQAEQAVNVLQQPAATETTEAAAEQLQATINEELRIEITGAESWITVRGAKNKRLAEKLYKSGEVLSFNDNEQYRLTVGAPANVKIYYKGQVVPLKVDGRVARFKLPLAN